MEESKDTTTIKLKKKTKGRLDKLRKHHRESYEEVIQRVLLILNVLRNEPFEAQEKLISLDEEIQKEKSSSQA